MPSPPETRATAARALVRALVGGLRTLARRVARRRLGRPAEGQTRDLSRPVSRTLQALTALAVLLFVGLLAGAGTMLWVLHDLPLAEAASRAPERSLALEAANGTALGRLGPLKLADAPPDAFPDILVEAVLSIEDRRFFAHGGIDLAGIARALLRNYDAGTVVEGGSTITQQLVKLRYLGSQRTYGRKLREAFLAVWLELRLSKREILARYLNSIYMGGGAEGVPAAARLYFDKAPFELTLGEAALLAGLIKAPSRYNPLQNPDLAHRRALQVLVAMVQKGVIDQAAATAAGEHPAELQQPAMALASGRWFSDWVGREAFEVTGNFDGQIRVRTTLIPRLQSLAEGVVADALKNNAEHNVTQAALVAMRPDGAVVAMVGGGDYAQSRFNRAVQARRQPGSAFKLFVYLAALRAGSRLEDPIDASPLQVNGWEPANYGGREYGTVTLADAFARSINTAAVRLALQVGVDNVIAAARDLGIDAPLPHVPSLALGSAEVSLLNLTAAYAAVRAGSAPVRPWGVASFASPTEPREVSVGPPEGPHQPLGGLKARLTELLQLPIARGTAREAALAGFAAGKTGTTQENRDAWFIGFNETLVVGVWVGNDDSSPMRGVTGGSLPALMWKQFMTAAGRQPVPPEEAGQGKAAPTEEAPQRARCDVAACAEKYQSFDTGDCTYQPYGGGQRRYCEIGALTTAEIVPQQRAPQEGAGGGAACNYDACAATYSSFRREDCTYQPYDGGARRQCHR
jgi:1A family penicillin-binding protein